MSNTDARTNQLFVKPARLKGAKEPLLVRQPERNHAPLPAKGAWVPKNSYWNRLLRDKDVVKATPPKEAKAPPAKKEVTEENS